MSPNNVTVFAKCIAIFVLHEANMNWIIYIFRTHLFNAMTYNMFACFPWVSHYFPHKTHLPVRSHLDRGSCEAK